MQTIDVNLKGRAFEDFFTVSGLQQLDQEFLDYLKANNPLVHAHLLAYRAGETFSAQAISQLLIDCGPILESFVAELFNIEEAVARLQITSLSHDPIFAFKKHYVLREARRALSRRKNEVEFQKLNSWLKKKLQDFEFKSEDLELSVAKLGLRFLEDEDNYRDDCERLIDWCVAAMMTPEGQETVQSWVSFRLPNKLNYANLVNIEPVENDAAGRLQGLPSARRHRDGFQLTDPRMSAREVQNEIHYCVYCHPTDGDFCSKGFPIKKTNLSQGLKINPLEETLIGCPLDEKISEMHFLKKQGYGIGALAVVMVDNPMCPATGHRICNDCMKACIYQKQDPVNIPQAETHILTDVLGLPWGVEIYDLFTRWNPLRRDQILPKPYNGLKVLVMGMGPAGFTLAHYLLMEGFAVVGMEGLKIEPLPEEYLRSPIFHYSDIVEKLDNRVMAGFGGVAEYGITVRWDKNFLKLIYMSLMRRQHFQVFGSVRFGGTLKVEDAWELGFDHVALALGAGLPRELPIKHSLAPGMRQANDFLMALQLTGAAKQSSLANLEVRLPAVIIGGGLTGVDTATEVQAYYIAQVEKVHDRYQVLIKALGEEKVRGQFDAHALVILDEFIGHAKAIAKERHLASQENRDPQLNELLRAWGGVTIAYRRTMQESPAYRRNHEELANALDEGIYYAEGLEPVSAVLDDWGYVSALRCRARIMDETGEWMFSDEEVTLAARSIFVATGAKPNVAYEFEHRGTFQRDGFAYRRYELVDHQLKATEEVGHPKMAHFGPFTSYEKENHRVSFLGDTHPIFHGSVVKAIASAKRSYPSIVNSLSDKMKQGDEQEYRVFRERLENIFKACVVSVQRRSSSIIELTVKAPSAAYHFSPGQFYRIQNYESHAQKLGSTKLQTEALALLGVIRDDHPDWISFFVFEQGASSKLVATFKEGDRLSVMGPTGAKSLLPTEGRKQTFLFIGGGLAAVHLLSHGAKLKALGHEVYFIGYFSKEEEIFCRQEIENVTDDIVWIIKNNDPASLINTIAQQKVISLPDVDCVMTIGSSDLLRQIQKARHGILKELFSDHAQFLGSVYGPMQCMLKGVCAQCLQWQIDPQTGKRTKAVYACSWQNQPMEIIDIDNIDERLGQNKMQETLSNLWLDYLFSKYPVNRK